MLFKMSDVSDSYFLDKNLFSMVHKNEESLQGAELSVGIGSFETQ